MPKASKNKQRCELMTSPEKRRAADALVASLRANFPKGVSAPALRALHGAGYTKLKDLARAKEADLALLHGMGPKALGILKAALKDAGLNFKSA
jgi:predicted Fe-Mo cluster-binding NifX family protein